MTRQAGQTRDKRNIWWRVLFVLLPLAGVLCIGTLFFAESLVTSRGPSFIPVDLRSVLEANYRQDLNRPQILGVRLDLLWEAIDDRDPEAADLEARKALLLSSLQTPVPFVTPQACQGIHIIYASQDTWIDSAGPTVGHGNDAVLHLGRAGEEHTRRVLLYFPINGSVPQGTFISRARLEMDIPEGSNPARCEPLLLWNLTAPFLESTTDWSSQPEPQIHYRAVALGGTDIHAWDVTDLVRDWLLGRYQNNGIVLDPRSCHEYTARYFSREAAGRDGEKIATAIGGGGPRLVIDCGGCLPRSRNVAAAAATATPPGRDPIPPAGVSWTPAAASTPTLVPTPGATTGTCSALPPSLLADTQNPPSAPVDSHISAFSISAHQSAAILHTPSPCDHESSAASAD